VANYAIVLGKREIRPVVLPETMLLAAICFADMIQTLVVVRGHLAVEANPILAAAMSYSPWIFALVKTASFLIPLTAVEVLRPMSPRFVRLALRIGATGYLLLYLLGTMRINHLLPMHL
jgi:membrane associated rhomboid family serine protease